MKLMKFVFWGVGTTPKHKFLAHFLALINESREAGLYEA